MIAFACGGCGKAFAVPEEYAGRRAACRACGYTVQVPGDPSANSAPPTPITAPIAAKVPASILSTPKTTTAIVASSAKNPVLIAQAPEASMTGASITETVVAETPINIPNPIDLPAPKHAASGERSPAASEKKSKSPRLPVRTRRLMSEAQQMRDAFTTSHIIRVTPMGAEPPERYRIDYTIDSFERLDRGKPAPRKNHQVEIQLTSEYPRMSPKCKMLSPVFHPNIDETTICVGDHWTAGEKLTDLVIRIGEMLAYQAYNIKSPLNAEAAMWADLNSEKLPTDPSNIRPAELD